MDRDSNDEFATHIINGVAGAFFFLGGLALTIWGWGPGPAGGVPLMLAGIAFPLYQAYKAGKSRDYKANRRAERAPTDGYEIRSKNYSERKR